MKSETIVQLINEISSHKKIKTSTSITSQIKKNEDMISFLRAKFPNRSLAEQCWLIYHDISVPLCKCGNETKFQNWFQGFGKFCSVSCASTENVSKSLYQQKRKIEEFEVNCVTCGKIFFTKKKSRIACSKSCGQIYNHSVRSDEMKELIDKKRKITCIEKYGNEYVVNSEYSRSKTEDKLGTRYAYLTENARKNWRTALIKKYGEDNPMKVESILNKMINTKLEKYGSLLTPSFRYKDYIFPSGKTVKIQGYENRALDILLKTYSEDDIVVGRKILKITGDFIYKLGDKIHRYYPDIFIVSENKIIEVKSSFTLDRQSNTNELKKNSVLEKGYRFEFMIL